MWRSVRGCRTRPTRTPASEGTPRPTHPRPARPCRDPRTRPSSRACPTSRVVPSTLSNRRSTRTHPDPGRRPRWKPQMAPVGTCGQPRTQVWLSRLGFGLGVKPKPRTRKAVALSIRRDSCALNLSAPATNGFENAVADPFGREHVSPQIKRRPHDAGTPGRTQTMRRRTVVVEMAARTHGDCVAEEESAMHLRMKGKESAVSNPQDCQLSGANMSGRCRCRGSGTSEAGQQELDRLDNPANPFREER